MADIMEEIQKLEASDKSTATTIAEPKTRKKRTTTKKFNDNEISKYFVLMFNFLAKILQIDKQYTEEDFLLEAEMMESISKKWDIVNKGLHFISPVILLLSVCEKAYEMYMLKKNPTYNAPTGGAEYGEY